MNICKKSKNNIKSRIGLIPLLIILFLICQNISIANENNYLAAPSLFKLIEKHDDSADSDKLESIRVDVAYLDSFLKDLKNRLDIFANNSFPEGILNKSRALLELVEIIKTEDNILKARVKLDGNYAILYLFNDETTKEQIRQRINLEGEDLQLARSRGYWIEVIEPKWARGVKRYWNHDRVLYSNSIKFFTPDLGGFTSVYRAIYWAKGDYIPKITKFISKLTKDRFTVAPTRDSGNTHIIAQVRMYNYLKKRGVKGLIYPKYFLELENNRKKVILFEELKGQSLLAKVKKGPNILEEKVIDITVNVSGIIESMHNVGVSHWDIKPGNVFIADSGEVLVFDLDFAFMSSGDFRERSLHKKITPQYASLNRINNRLSDTVPENISDDTIKDEVYSLAMTMARVLIGKGGLYKIFGNLAYKSKAETKRDYMGKFKPFLESNAHMENIKNNGKHISPVVLKVLEKALSRGESQYSTVQEFIDALKKVQIEVLKTSVEPSQEFDHSV